jgi:probable F420-dependent oxidoreductase
VKIDGSISNEMSQAAVTASRAELAGYDGAWVPETNHDPFLSCALGAEHTERLEVGTCVAIAFARSPMTIAHTAYDLQAYSEGRFILGLGTQVKSHVQHRFSMPWSRPAARMREFVSAMRAIWSAWDDGGKLHFEGDFYTHTLMTPMFDPGPNPHGPPRVFLSGVGELMSEVAGEVADGFIGHAFSTERYLREVTLPALRRGRQKAGKDLEGFEVVIPSQVVSTVIENETADAVRQARKRLAFYGSTPAYKPVLELHGWEHAHDELYAMSKRGDWDKMADVIDDDMLHAFAVVGEPDTVAAALLKRYADVATRLSFNTLDQSDPQRWGGLRAAIRQGTR